MKQVFSQRGQVTVEDVPVPLCRPGTVLVQTAWSLVSGGTERADIAGQRVGSRLRREPQALRKVWSELHRSGLTETMRLVGDKIERPIALGNSLAGTVVEVGAGIGDLRVGDRVACGGTGYAHHAEFVVVPRNLLAWIDDAVETRDAAFVTLGAIALQGVRRAAVQIGETAVVVGLGLIGLLTVQLLRAAGIRVLGLDPVKERSTLAERLGAERGLMVDEGDAVAAVLDATDGVGADAVLLTASTSDSSPINQAFEMARERGRIVIVGDVGLHLTRPTFYRKELDVVMSRSTGPGRYDRTYEEHGLDYPLPQARWTEGRNMEAFLRLLSQGAVRVPDLIAGEFPVNEASRAYASLGSTGSGVAVLLRYAAAGGAPMRRRVVVRDQAPVRTPVTRVALIGAGEFARQTLLPMLARHPAVSLRAIVGGASGTGLHDARRFRAESYATDPREVFDDRSVDAVVIATRHHLHAELAIEAARRGKAVFVEKPLALTLGECRRVADAVAETGALLTVGFNRRFAPLACRARTALMAAAGPALAVYRVNARALPPGHWLLDPLEGGGRIVGEACHFFDLLCWLLGEEPESITAMAPAGAGTPPQELTATMRLSAGSVATLVYSACGHPSLSKERIEVFKGGTAVVLDDFRLLTVNGRREKAGTDHKGYDAELTGFFGAVRGETPLQVTVEDGSRATFLALTAQEAAGTGRALSARWSEAL